jgi:putative hydrolase of the HAD superfamily
VTTRTGPAGDIRPVRLRAVLFDLDDTLLDYTASEAAAIRAYLAVLGIPEDRRDAAARAWHDLQEQHFARFLTGELDFTGQRRARAADMLRWLGLDGDVPPETLDTWFDGYRRQYEASLTAFPDAAPALAALAACQDPPVLGIISNANEAYTRTKLAILGIDHHFTCVVCTDTVGCAKPDPRIFRHACDLLGLPPAQVAYVGDRHDTDAAAATAAGLHGLWLDRRGTTTPPPAVRRVPDLTTLLVTLGLEPDLGPGQAVR